MKSVELGVRSIWTQRAAPALPNKGEQTPPTKPIASSRYVRAVSLADAAMIASVRISPRAVRRCAFTVARALDALDSETDATPRARRDAAALILGRCATCGACEG